MDLSAHNLIGSLIYAITKAASTNTELNKGSAAVNNNIRGLIMAESYLNSEERQNLQPTAHFPVV